MPSLLDVWNVTRLRLIVELSRSANLSEAAKAVGLSQPAASEHVRLINAAAGEPVISRRGRSLQLNSAGKVLATYAAQALASLDAGDSALAALAGLRRGHLHLGASSMPGTYLVPDVLEQFQERCPDVTVEVSVAATTQVVEWLRSGRVSAAVTCAEVRTGSLSVSPLGPDAIVGIARPQTMAISSTGHVRAAELAGSRLLLQEEGSSIRDFAHTLLKETPHDFGQVWELGSVDAAKRAVRQGRGIGFVSPHSIVEERRRGELVAFRVADVELPVRSVNLLRHLGTTPSPAERYFAQLLQMHLRRSDPVTHDSHL